MYGPPRRLPRRPLGPLFNLSVNGRRLLLGVTCERLKAEEDAECRWEGNGWRSWD